MKFSTRWMHYLKIQRQFIFALCSYMFIHNIILKNSLVINLKNTAKSHYLYYAIHGDPNKT